MSGYYMLSKYLDPKNDLAFKRIFGEAKHKNIPISFLNAVFNLSGEDEIIDLEFINLSQPPEISSRKQSIVDVLVRDQKGTKYVIEMQVAKVSGFEERAQFYAAKTYCSGMNSGHDYTGLRRVVFLAITDYIVFPEKADYKSDHITLDKKTLEHDLQGFSFTFVELPKFTKEDYTNLSLEEKWYYFLKHADEKNTIPCGLNEDPNIVEAYHVLERFNWSEEDLSSYEDVALSVADAKNALKAAEQDGEARGRAEREEEIAKELILDGMDVKKVSKITGLSIDILQELMNIPPV